MTKRQIEEFLVLNKGYLKKSNLEVAKRMWKLSSKPNIPTKLEDIKKELKQISEIQSNLRKAVQIETNSFDSQLLQVYEKIAQERNREPRRLFLDIETSPCIGFFWKPGHKISIGYENILKESAIICICWKFEDEDKVHSLQWDKGNDAQMLKQFSKIINSSDVICGHNLDQYDLKFLKSRCLFHNIQLNPKFQTIDTLKLSRNHFRFNSNRLDYLSKFLGNHGKKETSYNLWKEIVLNNCKESMNTMVNYCKNDVLILQEVYDKLKKLSPQKKVKFNI